MFTSQSNSSQSRYSKNSSSSEGKQLPCCLLGQDNIVTYKFLVNVASGDYSTFALQQIILEELKKEFPGIEAINLFLLQEIFSKRFPSRNASDKFICITEEELFLKLDNLDHETTIYFKVTKLFGIKGFTRVEEVQCNFKTPEGNIEMPILIPNCGVDLKQFHKFLSERFRTDVKIVFFDKNTKKQITSFDTVTKQLLEDNDVQVNFTNLKTIIEKFLNQSINIDVFLNFLYKGPVKLTLSDYAFFKNKNICEFSRDRVYCGIDISRVLPGNFTTEFDSATAHLALCGRSGCGKSATIAEFAKKYPVVYLDLKNQEDIKTEIIKCFPECCKSQSEGVDQDISVIIKENEELQSKLIIKLNLFLISGFSYILWRINHEPNLLNIFLEQMNGSRNKLADTFKSLNELELDANTIKKLKSELFERLSQHADASQSCSDAGKQVPKNIKELKPIFAIDEIQQLSTVLVNKKFVISKSFSLDNQDELESYYRSCLYAFQLALNSCEIRSIISGVEYNFYNEDDFRSPSLTCGRVFSFPSCNDPTSLINSILNVEEGVLEKYKLALEYFKGRYRYVSQVIRAALLKAKSYADTGRTIPNILSETDFKEILDKSFQYLRGFASEITNNVNDTIIDMYIDNPDMVKSLSLTTLTPTQFNILTPNSGPSIYYDNNFDSSYILDEPYTRNLLLKSFDKKKVYSTKFLQNFSKKEMSIKGAIFEHIMLLHFFDIGKQNLKLGNLPFIQITQIPDWFKPYEALLFKIDSFKDSSTIIDDNDYLNSLQTSVLLSPSFFCGPDGILFLHENELELFILFGMKYTSKRITGSVSAKNRSATIIKHPNAKILRILLEYEEELANSSKCFVENDVLTIALSTSDIIELFNITNKADDKAFGNNLRRILTIKNPSTDVNPSSVIKATKRTLSTHKKAGSKKPKLNHSCKCTSGCVNRKCSCKKSNSACQASCSCSNCQNH